jgi:hypothetical protein
MVFAIADDTEQNEEDNGLRGSTLNNMNDLFDAVDVDAKARQFVLRGLTSLLVGFFHEKLPDFSCHKHSIQCYQKGFCNH